MEFADLLFSAWAADIFPAVSSPQNFLALSDPLKIHYRLGGDDVVDSRHSVPGILTSAP
jgi:hypothetical protein